LTGGVRLWDLATGQERGSFQGHLGDVAGLAFSPDGKTLATGGADTTVLLWDLTKAAPVPSAEVADTDLDRLWTALAGDQAATAIPAVMTLASAPTRAVPFLSAKLAPVAGVDAKHLQRLIDELGSEKVETARQASAELERYGRLAAAALKQALAKSSDVDAKLRIHVLLARLETGLGSSEALRTLRAIQSLELAGTKEAKAHLEKLAAGAADSEVTREAKGAVDRLTP
jgi:hypothetical protein